ncbi:MAG: hypothetical protein K2L10_09925 [Ruminococcus sp.]|nr:hypothetical protein [Ruminococcus sp.]
MGFFSKFFKQKIGTETRKTIQKIKLWEQKHFPHLNDSNKNLRYSVYLTDSKKRISLSAIRIPKPKQSEQKNIIDMFRDVVDFFSKDRLTVFIAEYLEKFHNEMTTFMDNLSKLRLLSKDCQKDPIFNKIDYIFNLKLKILYNELIFCKFHKLNNLEYFMEINERLAVIYSDMQNLNNDFSECMYAMSSLEYADVQYYLESINMRVEMLTQTTKEILNK